MEPNNQPSIRTSFLVTLVGATVLGLTVITLFLTFFADQFLTNAQEIDKTVSATTAADLNVKTMQTVDIEIIEHAQYGKKTVVRHLDAGRDKTFVLYREDFIGFEPMEQLIGYSRRENIIRISGESEPNAVVMMTLDAHAHARQMTTSNENGRWMMELKASDFPPGTYHATITTSKNDVVSDTFVAGAFTVDERKAISNATWVLLFSVCAGVILFLVMVNVLVLVTHRHQGKR